ncbi:glycine-rich cell wall structural protein 1.8-like [Quercus lobata]|uniref:glycine-rich cell wall structural protein 1.8-like n=1 Tax=Quercus lobata TaxID=97700 RepID=UPI001246F261|nr:glycine-rich cell wall structural protein 1.8-like [Quercus lobata]
MRGLIVSTGTTRMQGSIEEITSIGCLETMILDILNKIEQIIEHFEQRGQLAHDRGGALDVEEGAGGHGGDGRSEHGGGNGDGEEGRGGHGGDGRSEHGGGNGDGEEGRGGNGGDNGDADGEDGSVDGGDGDEGDHSDGHGGEDDGEEGTGGHGGVIACLVDGSSQIGSGRLPLFLKSDALSSNAVIRAFLSFSSLSFEPGLAETI